MKRNIIRGLGAFTGLATLSLLFELLPSPAQYAGATSGSALSVPQAQLIQPDALNHLLQAKGTDKPLVLQVGSHDLYGEAHIPGSEYAGPGSHSTGLDLQHSKVAALPKDKSIVLYCGCCPWNRCPNLGPAFQHLHEMGFTHVKVLYLADNFGANWVDKGYPIERGR
jgi:thiosulfate/3-mercaptopyruvate sulfurtransferase